MALAMSVTLSFTELFDVAAHSEFELAGITEHGLSLDSINRLKDKGLTFSEVADVVISPRTLKHRKSRGERLSQEETDRAVRVARIVSLAAQVFSSHEKGLAWLRSPDDRLNSRTPLSLLQTEAGGRAIENMLWQIEEGIYA